MRERQVGLPPNLALRADAWGLGWIIFDDIPGATVIGHNGGTIGQSAFLRMVPECGVAVALLTNGGDTVRLYHEVVGHVLAELAGVELPALRVPPVDPPRIDASRYVGTYSSQVNDLTVTQEEDGRIWLTVVPKALSAELGRQVERWELVALGDDALINAEPEDGVYMRYVFAGDDGTGRARYLHTGRANRRVST
jgi:hypothetical protein